MCNICGGNACDGNICGGIFCADVVQWLQHSKVATIVQSQSASGASGVIPLLCSFVKLLFIPSVYRTGMVKLGHLLHPHRFFVLFVALSMRSVENTFVFFVSFKAS